MSSAGISFGGLASGIDSRAIISALVAVERRPINALEQKKTSLNKQKSLYGDLRGLLDKLATEAKALQRTTDFLRMAAASDDPAVLTATAGSSATPGSHVLRVNTLARAQLNASTGSASPTTSLGGPATIQLDVGGNTHFIAVDSPNLQTIASAINAHDDANTTGVRAEVVDTGNTANGGAQRYQLVVRSTTTGADGAFTIAADDGDAAFVSLMGNVAGNQLVAPTNASITLNNAVTVYRSSNTISDLIAGVTLDLKSVPSPNKDVTITVTTDAEETSKKLQSLVDAYNKVVDFFAAQGSLDANGKAQSPLFGDPTLRSARSSLRTIMGSSVAGTGNTAYQMLSQIGITADTAGKLTFNRSKFEEALAADEGAVAAIFTNATSGLAKWLVDGVKVYTDSVDGLIKTRTDGFDSQVKQTQSRIDQAERRLTRFEQALQTKYSNLESLLSRLQSQGSSVGAINSLSRR
jgi:flagellar hook-associated protein 2